MARPLRIQYPGAVYHVISRGNERKRIVRDDRDREKRLDWLRRAVETYGWQLHSFVLMDNHEHLFLETPLANLAAGMQYLNGSYTGYFNRRHRRAGHLFQGRYQGHLVEEEGYFLQISRYIHLNPVRAKMVGDPDEYRWSSFSGYVHSARQVPWICYEKVLGEFDQDAAGARRAYGQFVRAGMEDPPDSPFRNATGGLLLGSEHFVSRIKELIAVRSADREVPSLARLKNRPALAEIAQAVAQEFGGDAKRWAAGCRSDNGSRAAAAYLARVRFGYSAKDIATALNYRDGSAVTHAVKRVEAGGKTLGLVIARLEKQLS